MKIDSNYDVLVIGSGAAGLTLALSLPTQYRIAVLSKEAMREGSTMYAQGGIAGVLDTQDSVDAHVKDTLDAGAGLCDEEVVRFTVENSTAAIHWLEDVGVPFTREQANDDRSSLHLTREGGHSHRRIAHAADASGEAIENSLVEQARQRPNIDLLEHHISIDLITTRKLKQHYKQRDNRCVGAYVLDRRSNHIEAIGAGFTVLATGGASKVYLYTSNPDGTSGDGIAMAWRAGCRVANMEFMQFHPTCLYHPHAKSSLITEAVRGEGGHLLLADGSRFMHTFDERAELAPRDIVARAIDHEMKRLGLDCVYLDISHKPRDLILSHFPNIYATCQSFGYDMTQQPIPVVPAAHYTCGGIMTDQQGCTDLDGLYAIGEVTYTGLHGANRLASNSLLECIVFAKAASEDITKRLHDDPPSLPTLTAWDASRVTDSDEHVVITHNWDEIRRFMWDYVGIVRTTKRLQRARHRIELLLREIDEYYANFSMDSDLIELRNLSLVAWLIIRSALNRSESRGLHYTLDFPDRNDRLAQIPTILDPISMSPPH